MRTVRIASFAKGANNRAPDNRLPKDSARRLVNVVARADGSLAMAPGAAQILSATLVGALAHGDDVVYATPTELRTLSGKLLATTKSQYMAGASLNGELYACNGVESFRIGASAQQWAVKPPTIRVSQSAGLLRAGRYRVAATTISDGRESAPSDVVLIDAAGGMTVTLSSPGMLYVSQPDGQIMYAQGIHSGTVQLQSLRDDTDTMRFEGFKPAPMGRHIADVGSQLAIASGRRVYLTVPQRPWMHNPDAWLSFQEPVTALASDGRTLIVCADKLYAITGLDTEQPSQSVIYDRAPVSGSAMMTIDGEAFALTHRGPLVVGAESPLPAAQAFAVSASSACGVVIEADGDKLLLFAKRGNPITNRLTAIEARQ